MKNRHFEAQITQAAACHAAPARCATGNKPGLQYAAADQCIAVGGSFEMHIVARSGQISPDLAQQRHVLQQRLQQQQCQSGTAAPTAAAAGASCKIMQGAAAVSVLI